MDANNAAYFLHPQKGICSNFFYDFTVKTYTQVNTLIYRELKSMLHFQEGVFESKVKQVSRVGYNKSGFEVDPRPGKSWDKKKGLAF
jgi:hypothetical protein